MLTVKTGIKTPFWCVWGGRFYFIMNLISTLHSNSSLGYSSDTRPRSTRFRLALLEPVPSSAVRLALLEPVPSSTGRLTVLELVSFKSVTSHMLCVSFNLKKNDINIIIVKYCVSLFTIYPNLSLNNEAHRSTSADRT